MGETLRLIGANTKVAAWFAAITVDTGRAKRLVKKLNSDPPKNEDEYIVFLQQLIDLIFDLDAIQAMGRSGLEAAKDNAVISQYTNEKELLKELITLLEQVLERMEDGE